MLKKITHLFFLFLVFLVTFLSPSSVQADNNITIFGSGDGVVTSEPFELSSGLARFDTRFNGAGILVVELIYDPVENPVYQGLTVGFAATYATNGPIFKTSQYLIIPHTTKYRLRVYNSNNEASWATKITPWNELQKSNPGNLQTSGVDYKAVYPVWLDAGKTYQFHFKFTPSFNMSPDLVVSIYGPEGNLIWQPYNDYYQKFYYVKEFSPVQTGLYFVNIMTGSEWELEWKT
jgi:hypothetical protein